MKIETAIEILSKDLNDPESPDIMDVREAERLGIEALKSIQAQRNISSFERQFRLPGETKE